MASAPGSSVNSSACTYCTPEGCDAVNCSRCLQQFGLFTRRHHCRACGGAFCSSCSARRLRLPERGFVYEVRVCDRCHEALSLEPVWEAETLTARLFLRVQEDKYTLEKPLFEMCRRKAPLKSLWRAKCQGGKFQQCLLTTMSLPDRCPIRVSGQEEAAALEKLVQSMRHPFLWPTVQVKYMLDRQRLVIVRPMARKGSLRDKLFRRDPIESYHVKYGQGGGRPLGLAEVARYGCQILEVLIYLVDRGLRCAHLHSGNVLLEGDGCYCIDMVENELLGLPLSASCPPPAESSEYSAQQLAVTMFGRVLFEMVTARRCHMDQLPREMLDGSIPPGPVLDLLRSILGASTLLPYKDLPSLQDLRASPLFSAVKLVADVRFITQATPHGTAASMLRKAARCALTADPSMYRNPSGAGADDTREAGESRGGLRASARPGDDTAQPGTSETGAEAARREDANGGSSSGQENDNSDAASVSGSSVRRKSSRSSKSRGSRSRGESRGESRRERRGDQGEGRSASRESGADGGSESARRSSIPVPPPPPPPRAPR